MRRVGKCYESGRRCAIPIYTLKCGNFTLDKRTNDMITCDRFLTRIRYERVPNGMIYQMEIICARCKSRTFVIYNDEAGAFTSICLNKDKTAPNP
jgi:hypothetical protein